MRRLIISCLMAGLAWVAQPQVAHSQGSADYGSGLKFNLNPEGTKYARFIMWSQFWYRSAQMNPGTSINGVPTNSATDILARRIRFLAYAQISPRYLILLHFGINNQTFASGGGSGTAGTGGYGVGKKPQIFFHDVWNEYAVVPAGKNAAGEPIKNTLYIGAGLHYWHGISRMTSASTLNFLTIDAPIFNWPLIENSDQFARLFGIYAKGKLGKLEYRLNYNKPFATNLTPPTSTSGTLTVPNIAVDNNGLSKLSLGGYLEYQFLEQEANVLPFKVGTYVGTKRVFTVGAGFYNQPDGTQSYAREGAIASGPMNTRRHAISLMAVDAFLDLPVGNKDKNIAVTAYGVYYNYNFGPNYLRNLGIANPATANPAFTGQRALAGPGNARAFVGTGSIWYAQAGLLLPKAVEKPKVRVQPFAAYALKDFEALGKAGNYYDFGANFYLDGHHAKITPQYSTRPVYTAPGTISGNKGEFLIQAQVYL